MDNDSLLINDIIAATFTLPELGSLHKHFQAHLCADLGVHGIEDIDELSGRSYLAQTLRPIPVKDHLTHSLMQAVYSLPKNSEWPLHECRGGCLDEELAHVALQARKRFLPQHSLRKCAVLRSTHGQMAPVGSVGEESYLLLWEKCKKPKWIYFVCVQDIDRLLDKFSPDNWSFLHFWKDSDGAQSRTTIAPPPGFKFLE